MSFKKLLSRDSIRKSALLLIGLVSLVTLLAFVPDLVVRSQVDRHALKNRINNLLKSDQFIFSYDDLETSFYRGIILYQFSISTSPDDGPRRTLVNAPDLEIQISWLSLLREQKLVIKSVIAKRADLNLEFGPEGFQAADLTDFNKWLLTSKGLSVSAFDASLNLTIGLGGYQKTQWSFKQTDLALIYDSKKLTASFEHSHPYWGDTVSWFKSMPCPEAKKKGDKPPTCDLFNGTYEFDIDAFPAAKLSWLFNDYQITSGNLSGHINMQQGYEGASLTSLLEFEKIDVFEKETVIFKQLFGNLNTRINLGEKQVDSIFQGQYFNVPFNLEYSRSVKELWPEKLKFELLFKKSNELPLPYDMKLSGVKNVLFTISKPPRKSKYKTYRMIGANILAEQGLFTLNGKKINIPKLSFQAADHKFGFDLALNSGSSDLDIALGGKITTKTVKFKPILDRYKDYKNNTKFKMVRFKLVSKGEINSKQIHWQELKKILAALNKYYSARIGKTREISYIRPRLMQREWFSRYMMQNYLNADVNIGALNWGKESFTNVTGLIDMGYPKLEFELEDDLKNEFRFVWSYPGNQPRYKIESQIAMQNAAPIFRPWFDPEVLAEFRGMKLDFSYRSKGERLVDIHEAKKVKARFDLTDTVLGPFFKEQKIVKSWPEMIIKYKREYGKARAKIETRLNKSKLKMTANRRQAADPWQISFK